MGENGNSKGANSLWGKTFLLGCLSLVSNATRHHYLNNSRKSIINCTRRDLILIVLIAEE